MELVLSGVSKTYPNGVKALNDVTLTIPRGMFGLLGPNGAGKSSLMRSVATLQQIDSGTMTFGGIDITKEPDKLRDVLGYLPQDFGVYPKVSAVEMLDHLARLKGLDARGLRRDTVDALLKQVNLWDVRKKALGGYSGGMRQRFGVAVALLGNPKLLIVDEPTAGLDPAERARFLNLLSELGERSVVILSTHIVEDVAELCTRMAIIDRGRILLEAEPQQAMAGIRGRIWRRVAAREELPALQRDHGVISTTLLGGRTFVRKRVAKNGNLAIAYHRLRDQFRTLERFALMDAGLVPALAGEENNSHEYFYDMEYLAGHAPLAECAPAVQAAALEQLLDRFDGHLYCRRNRHAGVAEDWLRRHFEVGEMCLGRMQRQVGQWALVVVTHDEQATDAQSLIAANEGIRFVDHDQFLR